MRPTPEQFWTYWEWLIEQNGIIGGLILAGCLIALGFLVGLIVSVIKHGPGEGFLQMARTIGELFVVDIPKFSLRRVWAIAKLAIKESIRKKVLVVVGVFIVGMMFAGWYLDQNADHPARLYITFVLTMTNYMVILLGVFISCFSIPADIKSRTIYTIVTKPVRPLELFFGRVLGFMTIGTLVIASMGLLSYFFVVRGLYHEHEVETINPDSRSGETSRVHRHRHTFTVNEGGNGQTDETKGHSHRVRKVGEKYVIEGPSDDLTARVPIYAKKISFTGRDGVENEGYNVGYISEYQKFIEGDSLSSAIWRFQGVSPSLFANEKFINYDMEISAFRTYKGDIVTPVGGIIYFRSTDQTVETERIAFKVKEFQTDRRKIPLKVKGARKVKGANANEEDKFEPAELDFFKDIASDGSFEVVIRCQDRGQYLGMAQADLYLRPSDRPFVWNFIKGYVSIWLQMLIVVSFGVMFSCFLSAPVGIIATCVVLVLGFVGSFVDQMYENKLGGGGLSESIIRLPTHQGSQQELDLSNPTLEAGLRRGDRIILYGILLLKNAAPNFASLGTADYVAYGVNLSGGLLSRHLTIAFGYFILTWIVSFFFLKTREMAA